MTLKNPIDIEWICQKFGLEMLCDKYGEKALGINEIHRVQKGDITFVDTPKYYQKVLESPASVIIINQNITCPEGKCLLFSQNPFQSYNALANYFNPTSITNDAIHPTAIIGENTILAKGVVIGQNVRIGNNCIIYPNTTIYANTTIGNNCIIHANTTIGSDAFYFNSQQGEYHKMHSIGSVIIGDKVEIGSSCTIDRGVSAITKIGKGTKIDNQVHIAHGVEIGENCLLCAQVAIAGKSKIGNGVILYGKVGISKGIEIGAGAIILASSNVDKNLEGGKKYFGSPAIEAREAMKHLAALRLLPQYINSVREMLKQSELIEKQY